MSDESRTRWHAGLLLLLVYLTGAATGGGLVYAIRQRSPEFRVQPRMGTGSGPVLNLDRFNLTDAQRQAIQRIVEESQPRTDSILNQTLPSLRAEADSIHVRIRAVLTPEQRRQFDAMPTVRTP
jgi:Spy/CpxP family protein refolding chaperone